MAALVQEWGNDPDNWQLQARFLSPDTAAISNSHGELSFLSVATNSLTKQKVHESLINGFSLLDNNTIVSCSTDGIKVFDIRTNTVTSLVPHSKPYLSVTTNGSLIAGGTELVGYDADLNLFDIRKLQTVFKSYVDSHHDDMTAVEFHPSYSQYLMSGSTDGYVNIYDLNEEEEDDSLHQVINYSSVHSCHFISKKRISILSHMETLSFNELNNTNYEVWEEPAPNDLGDVRSKWPNCEYVVDINSQYLTYGSNSTGSLTVVPFDAKKESFGDKSIDFPGAHGEEVVRDLQILGSNAISCGEDGKIKLWRLSEALKKKKKKKDSRFKPY